MALNIDSIFISALTSISSLVEGRLYGTAIPLPDEDLDNAPVPYLIVSFDGLQNDQYSKDDYEGETDTVQISVEVCDKTLAKLHALTQAVRDAIHSYMQTNGESKGILDYSFTTSAINYDSLKPCYYQVLHYSCSTTK